MRNAARARPGSARQVATALEAAHEGERHRDLSLDVGVRPPDSTASGRPRWLMLSFGYRSDKRSIQ